MESRLPTRDLRPGGGLISPTAEREYFTLADTPAGAPGAALRVGDLVFAGGPLGSAPAAATGDVREQAQAAFEALAELLAMAGAEIGDVVDLLSFHGDSRTIESVFEIGRRYLGSEFPAWTPTAVSAHRSPGTRLALTAIASLAEGPKRCVVPETIEWWRDYPTAAGCRKGDLLFVAGQYGSDADGGVNTPGDHAGQARNALNRVAEICALAGVGLDDVIAIASSHQDPRWIPSVAAVYEDEFFVEAAGSAFPTWTAVGVPGLLRAGMLGQYRAVVESGSGARVGAAAEGHGAGAGHVCGAAARRGGRLVAATGVSPIEDDGRVPDRGDPEAQARAAFEMLLEALATLGASRDDLVQIVSFHLDPPALEAAERVAADLLDGAAPPVWTAVGMTGTRDEGQLHAISALAVR